jgi:F-type H+-transporting ATPase subunit delta
LIVSGGFATVHPNNKLTVNAVEGAPLEDFSAEVICCLFLYLRNLPDINRLVQAIRANLAEAQKVAAGSGSEEDKIEARIEMEVYEALQHAVVSK